MTEVFANASDGTPLEWVVRVPDGVGPWPALLLIHAGGFLGGTPNDPTLVACARDLTEAGYITFAITYRLAPPGSLPGQISLGRYPDQTDDVKLAVLAARFDARCNGQVGAVGGSAGGSHTVFVAATGTAGLDKIDVGVSLSGAYDFSDWDPTRPSFQADVTNYIGSVDRSPGGALQRASPLWLPTLSSVSPLLIVGTVMDPMPPDQLDDMTVLLTTLGVGFQSLTLPGNLHAFAYWPQIKGTAVAFLAAGFAQ